MVEVEVFSDVICPWCFVGKRRLGRALEILGERHEVRVGWRPFQLNPEMPREGMDRRAYRTAKFGSWERSRALDAQVAAVGRGEGIAFDFDRIGRTPNTFDAHRLVWLAGREGPQTQDAVVEGLFRGYFVAGKDAGDREALVEVARAAGMDAVSVEGSLEGEDGVSAVLEEEDRARRMGVNSVPQFVIDGTYGVTGAQEPETLVLAVEKILELTKSA